MKRTKFIIISILLFNTIINIGQEINTRYILEKDFSEFESIIKNDSINLVFIGDVMLHKNQIDLAHARFKEKYGFGERSHNKHYDFRGCYRELKSYFNDADLSIGNMEFSLAGYPFTGYPSFSAPDSYLDYLSDCGINVFLTANNHINDRGTKGSIRSLNTYKKLKDSLGIYFTGIGYTGIKPLIIRKQSIKLALINLTYGNNNTYIKDIAPYSLSDTEGIKSAFEAAKNEEVDIIIVLPHWGIEYTLTHSKKQEKEAQFLAELGADIIIGTHPHVVQDCDTLTTSDGCEVPIIYSLGNSISNMSAAHTQVGLLLKLSLIKGLDNNFQISKPEYIFTWCSLPNNLSDTYSVIPIKKHLGSKDLSLSEFEYDKMIFNYNQVKK